MEAELPIVNYGKKVGKIERKLSLYIYGAIFSWRTVRNYGWQGKRNPRMLFYFMEKLTLGLATFDEIKKVH